MHARAQRDAPEGPRTGCVRFNPLFPRPWHLILVEYDRHIEAGAEDARAGAAGAPEAKHRFAKRERADTDVGPGGCKGIIIAAGRQRQQRTEVAGATLQMARVLFASKEAPRPREKRIFAFTTSCRADSVPRPPPAFADAGGGTHTVEARSFTCV